MTSVFPQRPQDCAGSLASPGHASSRLVHWHLQYGQQRWSEREGATQAALSELPEGEPLGPRLVMSTRAAVSPSGLRRLSPPASHRDVRLGLHRAVWCPH